MMNLKILLLSACLCTLLGCQSFKANRRPQVAGFGGYCPECLVKNIDKDLAELQNLIQKTEGARAKETPKVRFATFFNTKGKAICQVDLFRHPDALPNFAELDKKEIVQNAASSAHRTPASTEENKLPPCSKKYLNELKKLAKNNVLLHGGTNFKKKVSLKMDITKAGAWCVLGGSIGLTISKYNPMGGVPGSIIAGTLGTNHAVGLLKTEKEYKQRWDLLKKENKVAKKLKVLPLDPKEDPLLNQKKKHWNKKASLTTLAFCSVAGNIIGEFLFHR